LAARWVVDNGTFKAKTEAETGMKTAKVCTENQSVHSIRTTGGSSRYENRLLSCERFVAGSRHQRM
jgi:hypothetical protein